VERELPGSEAIVSSDVDRPTTKPVRRNGLAELLDQWETLDEDLPEIDDPPLPPKDVF
jgi:hypothetical protein